MADSETEKNALEGKVIPSQMCRGLWIVPVTFQNTTLHFILDTGAVSTSVDPDALQKVKGRRIRAGRSTRLKNGEAGPLKINKIKVKSHEMDHLAQALGAEVDGILGFSVFKTLLLTLDYPDQEVRIAKGELPAEGDHIYRDYGKNRPFLAVETGEERLALLVDSGSTSGFTFRETDQLDWAIQPRPISAAVRYSNVRLNHAGRLADDVHYGPLTIRQPIVKVAHKKATRLSGYDILQHLEVTFDPSHERIRMIPKAEREIELPPEIGLGLAFRPRDDGLEVIHVVPEKSGAQAGVEKGDLLVQVDDRPIYQRDCQSLEKGQAGDIANYTFRRDGEPFEVSMPLVVLVE